MFPFERRRNKRLIVVALCVISLALIPSKARAFEGRGGDVVTIEADEVIDDDLYVGAGVFTLNGTVKGDVIVAGGTIEINGTIEGDLIAAGQSIVINGVVEDDARIAGYALSISGEVGDEVIAAGFSLEQKDGASLGDDLLFAGYQALLAGEIAGDVKVFGGALKLSGTIGGNVDADLGGAEPGEPSPAQFMFYPNMPTVPVIPAGLTVEEEASVGGDLRYTANAKAEIPTGAVKGDTEFTRYVPETKPETKEKPTLAARIGDWVVDQLRRLLTLLLVGVVMMWLAPNWTRQIAQLVQSKPLPSLGWGVVFIAAFLLVMLVLLLATVLLAIILGVVTLGELTGRMVMLGGIALSTVGFGFSVAWAYITKIVISLLLGQLLFCIFKSPGAEHRWYPMLLGVLLFVLITAIPVLGWLATLVTVLLGLGALWLWGYDWLRSRKAMTPVA